MILIIGAPGDLRTDVVEEELNRRQHPFQTLCTAHFPYSIKISSDISDPPRGSIKFPSDGGSNEINVEISDIESVYYCSHYTFPVLPEDLPEIQYTVRKNIESAFWSFLHSLTCPFINPIYPAEHHSYKPHILKLLRGHQIRVPDTLTTNDPEAVIEFYEAQKQSVIFKPTWGQAFTQKLTPEHLQPEHLAKLSNSPITMQEFIPGQDIRAYVIGQEVFAVEIQSTALDLNQDEAAQRVAIQLPPAIEAECLQVAEIAGLVFTGIDLRRTPEGEYVYFEANSSPDFSNDLYWTDYPLAEKLVDLLIQYE